MGRVTARVPSVRVELTPEGVKSVRRPDSLTVEEPMEIRVQGRALSVTMRTPGDDFDLALGFLVTEGLIGGAPDVATLMHCQDVGEDGRPTYNVVDVVLAPGVPIPDISAERNFYTTSSCGVCGKSSIDAVRTVSPYDVKTALPQLDPQVLGRLPEALRETQKVFDRTGGLHAAALFTPTGELLAAREDVGRHNAVDKLVGAQLLEGRLPLSESILMVSGRASFEIIQKAATAGIPIVCAVSAPSSLAVDAARRFGLTLVGFLRGERFNIYTRAERIGE
jgi:FdhD protein